MTPPWTLQVETPTTLRLPDLWRVGKTAEGCTGGAADGSFQRVIEHWMERGIRKTKTSWMSKFSNKKPSDWSIPSRYCTHLERWWTKQGFRLFQNRHDGKEKQTQLPAFPVSLSPGRGLRRVPGLPRSKLPAAACGEVAAASGTSQVCSRRVTTRNETFPDGKWCATDLELKNSSKHPTKNGLHSDLGMDQYLLIPLLVGWTSIYQLFWCSPGVQGFDTLPCGNRRSILFQSFLVTANPAIRRNPHRSQDIWRPQWPKGVMAGPDLKGAGSPPQKKTLWVNYTISLTWIKFGDFGMIPRNRTMIL